MDFQKTWLLWAFCLAVLIASSCERGPKLEAITKEGKILLSDGTSRDVPYYGDTAAVVLYVVRHAEKIIDKTNKNPDLSNVGKARAERLGEILKSARINALVPSEKKRSQQTVAGVKARLDPPIETVPTDVLPVWLDIALMQEHKGKILLVAHHSNTIPMLLNYLTAGKGKRYKEIDEDDYGNFFVVSTKGPGQTEIIELRY